jgi:hypothetical protein
MGEAMPDGCIYNRSAAKFHLKIELDRAKPAIVSIVANPARGLPGEVWRPALGRPEQRRFGRIDQPSAFSTILRHRFPRSDRIVL